ALTIIISGLTLLIARLSLRKWLRSIRSLLKGRRFLGKDFHSSPELQPVADELRKFIREMDRLHNIQALDSVQWTPKSLKNLLTREFDQSEVLIVSNREP